MVIITSKVRYKGNDLTLVREDEKWNNKPGGPIILITCLKHVVDYKDQIGLSPPTAYQ